MKNRVLAARYARALAQSLATDEELEKAATELRSLAALFAADAGLRSLFERPSLSAARRRMLVDEIVKAVPLGTRTARFFDLIVSNDRVALLSDCSEIFDRLRDERLGIVEAEVTTAIPLDESLEKKLMAALGRLTGRTIRLKKHVAPSIIGGAVARIGSVVYDGSLKSRIAALREELIGG